MAVLPVAQQLWPFPVAQVPEQSGQVGQPQEPAQLVSVGPAATAVPPTEAGETPRSLAKLRVSRRIATYLNTMVVRLLMVVCIM